MNQTETTRPPATRLESGSASQESSTGTFKVLFAGGGSGGHISPGLAIAERLPEIDAHASCHFVCSQRPIDDTMLTHAGASFTPIPATPPSIHPARAIRFAINFRKSRHLVRDLIDREGITHVVALGGFVAAPAVSAARDRGIPVLMTNLDDPPGRANRWIAPRCSLVVSAIDLSQHPDFARKIVGMPVRRSAITNDDPATCRASLGLDPARPTLLITGASQGSGSINRFIVAMIERQSDLFRGWQIHHLTGQGAESDIRQRYDDLGIRALVEPFRHDMWAAWGGASLAISRAGANSVAEAAINAVPSLFLPYPYHKDRHQEHNARPMVAQDGAVIETDHVDVETNQRLIGPVLADLMADRDRLVTMKSRLLENKPKDAAQTIAKLLAGLGS